MSLAAAIREVLSTDRDALVDIVHEAGTRLFRGQSGPRRPFVEELERYVHKDSNPLAPFSVQVTGAIPQKLLERDDTRIYARILNNGAQVVVIGTDKIDNAAGSSDAGYPLAAGTFVELLYHCGEVWALSPAGSQDVRVIDLAGG